MSARAGPLGSQPLGRPISSLIHGLGNAGIALVTDSERSVFARPSVRGRCAKRRLTASPLAGSAAEHGGYAGEKETPWHTDDQT